MSLPIWSKFTRIYSISGHVAKYRPDYDCLLLTEREIGSFAKISEKLGYFGRGNVPQEEIEIDKILTKLKLFKTKFHFRIFSIYDPLERGILSFHQFFKIVWNLCTVDILSLGYLLFDIYDLDHSGTFEFDEVRLLITELCDGILLNESDAEIVNQRLDELNYLAVSADTFVGLCRAYPIILKPLRNIQQILRNYFNLTKDFWDRQTKSRQFMTDSEYISMESLLTQQALLLKITRPIDENITSNEEFSQGVIQSAVRNTTCSHLPLSIQNTAKTSSSKLPPIQVIDYRERKQQQRQRQQQPSHEIVENSNSLTKSQELTQKSSSSSRYSHTTSSIPSFRDYVSDLRYALQRQDIQTIHRGAVFKEWKI